jgi:hypothetical protein
MRLFHKLILITASILMLGMAVLVVRTKRFPAAPDTMSAVLRRMQQYQHDGHYDDAISLGKEWTAKNPQNGSNDQVFGRIAFLYLEKAKRDDRNRDEYIAHAIEYRDKMLPVASDATLGWYSIAALQDSALISEYAGDLSDTQRCVQYRNAIKLAERSGYSLHEKQIQLSNRTDPKHDEFGYTIDDVQRLLKQSDATNSRVRDKAQRVGCR